MTTTTSSSPYTVDPDALFETIDASLSLLEKFDDPQFGYESLPTYELATRDRVVALVPIAQADHRTIARLQLLLESQHEFDLEVVALAPRATKQTQQQLDILATEWPHLNVLGSYARKPWKGLVRKALRAADSDFAIFLDPSGLASNVDYEELIKPLQSGSADAVVGSRFLGKTRPVLSRQAAKKNDRLRRLANRCVNLQLSDVDSGIVAVRTDALKQLLLDAPPQTLSLQLICRLAQWGARFYETPVEQPPTLDQAPRSELRNTLIGIREVIRTRFLRSQFTDHCGLHTLKSVETASRYNQWILKQCRPWLGQRMIEAGSGIGNLSTHLVERERLILVDYDPIYVRRLEERFQDQPHVRVQQADLTQTSHGRVWQAESVDTIFCSNVLEHLEPDDQVLRMFHDALTPGGHCIIIVPADPRLYTPLDKKLGHFRRYTETCLSQKFRRAGFEVAAAKQFNRFGTLGWFFNGKVLGRDDLSATQMKIFDRLWPVAKGLDRILPVPGMSLMVVGRKTS